MIRLSRSAGVVAATLLAFGLPPAAAQAAPRTVESTVDKLFPYLDAYLTLPAVERTGFVLSYRLLEHDSHKPAAPRVILVRGGEQVLLPVAPDGRFLIQPALADIKARLKVILEKPDEAKLTESLDILSTQPLRGDYAATDFNVGLTQANAAVRKAAGVFSLAAPRFSRVVFVGAGAGEMIDASGRSQPLPASRTGPAFDPKALATARSIRLSRPPERIEFAPAGD